MWVGLFAAMVAAVIFIRTTLRRGLQDKIDKSADYLIWTAWGDDRDQYKGDENTFSKTTATQNANAAQIEGSAGVNNNLDVSMTEGAVSSSVDELSQSQSILRTIDLDSID